MGKNTTFVYILLGALVLGFLFFVFFPAMRGEDKTYDNFSEASSNGSFANNGISSADRTPRIMYWTGKINHYIDFSGNWQSDPDNTSSVSIHPLTYCKKRYPKTISTRTYKQETANTWISGSGATKWSAVKTSIECVQP